MCKSVIFVDSPLKIPFLGKCTKDLSTFLLKWMKCCFESEMEAKLLLDVLFPIPLNEKIESREEWEIRD